MMSGPEGAQLPEDFEQFLQQRHAAAAEYVSGNPAPLGALVAEELPASFFSPRGDLTVGTEEEVATRYERDDAAFAPGSSNTMETIDAAAGDGIGYWVGIQRSQARMRDQDQPVPFTLRVTELYRREHGRWRLVHRHASPFQQET